MSPKTSERIATFNNKLDLLEAGVKDHPLSQLERAVLLDLQRMMRLLQAVRLIYSEAFQPDEHDALDKLETRVIAFANAHALDA